MSTYPAFTSLEEVIGFLNATGPDGNSNYLVYGLSVSSNSVQAYVNYANTFIGSFAPSVASTDPRYLFAKLAALDLACMAVLVAASGGMLLGAADYKLGDLFVTKGTVGKFSFESAVQSFQDSFTRNIVNLSTVAIGAKARLGYEVLRRKA